MRILRHIPVLCGLLIIGCAAPDASPSFVSERLYAMGTWVDVEFQSPDSETATRALNEVEQFLRTFERDYYPWAPGALADLNDALAGGGSATVAPELMALLQRSQELSAASGGFFDPGVGALVELWGFDSAPAEDFAPPSDEAIAATLAASGGIGALDLDELRAHSASAALKIDLGGIAKGAAVERAMQVLERYGVENALINAGGDLLAIGRAPGERAWRVGIRHTREDGTLGVIEIEDREAAFTSGDYERFYERDGQRLHHLLDPTTGKPATHTRALTVLCEDPVLADVAATAMFVAGPERWREVGAALGIDAALRVDASGEIELTAAMAARVRLSARTHDLIVGSPQE